ncbi:MAG: DJ-1/PfpI family protein [Puia sp.]
MIFIQKINSRIFFVLLLAATALYSKAQSDTTPKKVAIFLYKGAEILDLAGPSEVFSSSGFDTYTMSVDGNEILSQGFITIKPQYSLDNAPVPDIVVFPGGGSTAPANDPRVMAWVKKLHDRGSILMSVCTGAQILARAGYLDHKNITTWHGYIKDLQKLVPTAVVLGEYPLCRQWKYHYNRRCFSRNRRFPVPGIQVERNGSSQTNGLLYGI